MKRSSPIRIRTPWSTLVILVCLLLSPLRSHSSENLLAPSTDDFRSIISQAKKKVFPAVVYIRCVVDSHRGGEERSQDVFGSGVIISPEGHILTNWHVSRRSGEIRCQLNDGRSFDADLLGYDMEIDLAVLKLRLPENEDPIPYASLGDSSVLEEGEFVMAMGAPWGMSRSISIGIISCARRYLPRNSEYSLWLQTDAAISPGNSGGPLVNTQGEIIGINTLGIMFGGDIGFAIPSDMLKLLWPKLRDHGSAHWSWTGLHLQPIRDFVKNIYFEGDEGVIVADVDRGSPAALAGIQPKDRILRVNDEATHALFEEDLPHVRRIFALLERDVPAELTLLRNGKSFDTTLIPREKGQVDGDEISLQRWDFSAKAINQFADPELHFYKEKGVFISGLRWPGNAGLSGLVVRDIILKIGGKEIHSLDELQSAHSLALENISDSSRVSVEVLRNGIPRHFILDFSRDIGRR